ncbi:MAG: hypothetical protein ABI679_04035 [Gemmatimonadota bacterium]
MRFRPPWTFPVVVLAMLAGCGGNAGTGPNPNSNGSMSASLDGLTWTAVSVVAARAGNVVTVGGGNSNTIGIGFAMPDSGTGTYSIGPSSITNADVIDGAGSWIASAAGGPGVS